MINHSCEPNAWWIYEWHELRVRALLDVSAGEKVTFSYIDAFRNGDFLLRREELRRGWGIECTCSLCRQGDLGPRESLRNSVLAALQNVENIIPGSHESVIRQMEASRTELERLAEKLKAEGYTMDNWAMRNLNSHLSSI
jgi:hypothetical protein